jgi:hypothetical protein
MVDCDKFFRVVAHALTTLSGSYGLREVKREAESFGCFVYLANDVAGIRVSTEPYEGGVFVQVSALVDGEFPKYPLKIAEGTELRTFDLEDIVELAGGTADWNATDDVDEQVARVARSLSAFAAPILEGDFSAFGRLAANVKERARRLRVE